jgi:hypothetical protein
MYIPAAFGGGNVQVFMLNYCLGINTGYYFKFNCTVNIIDTSLRE